jgi:AraC-like DNA-binding protein
VRAKLFIDENYASEIDLDNIAGEACFSKFHFARLFREIYGKTPHQYLTGVRVEKAGQLLVSGVSVKEACFAVGFDSVSSFTGLFKRRTGVTPAAFQTEQARRKRQIAVSPLTHIPNCFAEKKGWSKNSNFRETEFIDRPAAVPE